MNIDDIKLQPHSLEAEKGILSCILLDDSKMSYLNYKKLVSDDFYQKEHQSVYKSMQSLAKAKKNIDVITLANELWKELDYIWWMDYLYDLSTFVITPTVIKSYTKIVKEKATLRNILKTNQQIIWDVYNEKNTTDIIEDLHNKLKDISKQTINKWEFRHISSEDKAMRWYEELINTDPRKIIKWWWKVWDDMLWWIYKGKIYLIWAETWVWKSTFINIISDKIQKEGHKVVKYSLEDRLEDKSKEEIYYLVNKLRAKDWKKRYMITHFINNEYWHPNWLFYDKEFESYVMKAMEILSKSNITELDKDRQIRIEDMVKLIEEEANNWTEFFAIDHLHYFDMGNWKERHDLQIQNVMHQLNECVRKFNITIFLVAHYKAWLKNDAMNPHYDMFKDWAAIKQVVNIIIQIVGVDEDTGETMFHFTKIRWWIKKQKIVWFFDIDNYDYNKMSLYIDNNWI